MSAERIAVALQAVADALSAQGYASSASAVVGSTYIKGTEDSDVDVLVYTPTVSPSEAVFSGWTYGGSGGSIEFDNPDKFGSWKREVGGVVVNLLLTGSEAYYDAWLTAAEVCRFLHLQGVPLTRGTVHGVHEIVMDDSDSDTEHQRRAYV